MESAQQKNLKQTGRTLKSVAILFTISGYIFGPMIILGGLGIWLGNRYESLVFPVVFLIAALVISNVLIFKRGKHVADKLNDSNE